MKTATTLLSATALTLAMATAAFADSNTAYIAQDGDTNTASVDQTGLGTMPAALAGSNQVGSSEDAASQIGMGNSIDITQSGLANRVGARTSGSGLEQTGANNVLIVDQTNGTPGVRNSGVTALHSNPGNTIKQAIQISDTGATGATNRAEINQNAEAGNSVSAFLQSHSGGGQNLLTIDQTMTGLNSRNNGNFVGKKDGNNNGVVQYGGGNTIDIDQDGRNNIVQLVSQGASVVAGFDNTATLSQDGNTNRIETVDQDGAGNDATITQLGDTNTVTMAMQDGTDNMMTITQNGVGNSVLDASQIGDYNMMAMDFQGDGNGVGAFTAGAAADLGLTQGTALQDSSLATASIEVTNDIQFDVFGNNNLFAFKQEGAGNTIDGDVGAADAFATGNQVAVLQVGNGNVSDFSQMGAGNVLGVSQ